MEIILVIIAIIVLLGIIIVIISPYKNFSETRNLKRESDINTILNAVYQYTIDNSSLPTTITKTKTEICATEATTCTGLVDLNMLKKYLSTLPRDPNGKCKTNGICYTIMKTVENRITITAPNAESDKIISVTR